MNSKKEIWIYHLVVMIVLIIVYSLLRVHAFKGLNWLLNALFGAENVISNLMFDILVCIAMVFTMILNLHSELQHYDNINCRI